MKLKKQPKQNYPVNRTIIRNITLSLSGTRYVQIASGAYVRVNAKPWCGKSERRRAIAARRWKRIENDLNAAMAGAQ